MKKLTTFLFIFFMLALSLSAENWVPEITNIQSEGNTVTILFNLSTSATTAEGAEVEIIQSDGTLLTSKKVGKSRKDAKKISFELKKSGKYLAQVTAWKGEEKQASEAKGFTFSLKLEKPAVTVLNKGNFTLEVSWKNVQEATSYLVRCSDGTQRETSSLQTIFSNLKPDTRYTITVSAIRENEMVTSDPFIKTARKDEERTWLFTEFGQSTNATLNSFTMHNSDNLNFSLKTCTFNEQDLTINEKGGKFTAFHDGISFYYTTINPKIENFSLTGTFHVDYINPTADGQEGFGIIAMDSLGQDGQSMVNHYTNSAAIIATKFEETINGVKKTSKDTIGARFVTNLTPQILQGGDQMIAQYGTSIGHAFSYDQSDLVRSNDVYTLTLKKDNTGYHAILKQTIASEGTVEEYTLYGADKLSVLDSDHLYLGFAAARGCNVTISDVKFSLTQTKDDPPPEEAPPTLVPLLTKIDSPTSYSSSDYPFTFITNCDGLLTVKIQNGKTLVNEEKVTANKDFVRHLTLQKGINDYQIIFQPQKDWQPYPHSVMASYDKDTKQYVESYNSVSIMQTVIYLNYPGTELYASKNGSPFGDGTKADPLDLNSAVSYCKMGQTIILTDSEYHLTRPLVIERGNDGTQTQRKTLRAANRAVLDFSSAGGGLQLWGSYWTIENIDITNTPDNVKGLQVAGNNNIIRAVNAYGNGDTGIQISGTSTEDYHKWPKDNLILGCVSHDNCDSAQNNADGFAAKLTVAEGNRFKNCIAYSNIDDGWDLFSKIESGPIGAVVIENCIAYKNGSLSDGTGKGDGNGFKLGGDGIAVKHVLRNSLSYNNGASGITSNSNPSVVLENVTSYGNGNYNITLYGKGTGERYFSTKDCLSLNGGLADNIKEVPDQDTGNNYYFNGAITTNGSQILDSTIFKSTDTKIVPVVTSQLTIDVHGLFSQALTAGCNF